jgi:hypothetical protein
MSAPYPLVVNTNVEASTEVKIFMADVVQLLGEIGQSLKALEGLKGTRAPAKEESQEVALSKIALKGPHALAKKAADFELDPVKVSNSMLWFKYAMAKDLDGLRQEMAKTVRLVESCTQLEVFAEAKEASKADPALCAKLDEMYYCEVGRAMWRIMGAIEKDRVKAKYEAWRSAQKG